MRCTALTIVCMAGLALGCAGNVSEPAAQSAADSAPAGSARSDLVRVDGDKLLIDSFQSCRVPASAGPHEVLLHSEASSREISRDRFVARTVVAARREAAKLANAHRSAIDEAVLGEASAAGSDFVCQEIAAPEGDVDWEISLVVGESDVTVSSVDVAHERLGAPVSNRSVSGHCAQDGMRTTFCASAQNGTALRNTRGQVVCARGQCVKASMGEWSCARATGGWAELDYSGRPTCEQGCYAPTSTQCQRMR